MRTELWDDFCRKFDVYGNCVPLFSVDDSGAVNVRTRGNSQRPYLTRSLACEEMILSVTDRLVADWESGARRLDGMLYMIGLKHSGRFVPLYIGKAETKGRNGGLSANLRNLHSDKSKFARWGDNYQYHIGDLSACVLPGHDVSARVRKYEAWAARLFVEGTHLREPVYFWATDWDRSHVGIWEDFGPTSLSALEYLLIAVAGDVSPDLLNREGLSRSDIDVADEEIADGEGTEGDVGPALNGGGAEFS